MREWSEHISDKTLHRIRIRGKRARYTAELAKAADQIEAGLRNCGLKVHRNEFEVSGTPRGTVKFRNVIAATGSWPASGASTAAASASIPRISR